MSQQDWIVHLARLNYAAGQLAQRGDAYVRCAQVRELADALECDVWNATHSPQSLNPIMSPRLGWTPTDTASIDNYFAPPTPRASTAAALTPPMGLFAFDVYTPAQPCPDKVARSGSKHKAKAPPKPA